MTDKDKDRHAEVEPVKDTHTSLQRDMSRQTCTYINTEKGGVHLEAVKGACRATQRVERKMYTSRRQTKVGTETHQSPQTVRDTDNQTPDACVGIASSKDRCRLTHKHNSAAERKRRTRS